MKTVPKSETLAAESPYFYAYVPTLEYADTDWVSPHDLEFSLANNGIIGFETSFAVGYTYLVKTGSISLTDMIKTMTTNPSDILKLGRGTMDKGMPADVMLADLNETFVYTKEEILSKAENSPYIGEELTGRVKLTIAGGSITYDELR